MRTTRGRGESAGGENEGCERRGERGTGEAEGKRKERNL